MHNTPLTADQLAFARDLFQRLCGEVERVHIDRRELVEQLLITLLCRGHSLVMGLPGSGQLRLCRAVCRSAGMTWRRIALTPESAAAEVFEQLVAPSADTSALMSHSWPNVVYAEEIYRAPSSTQAALVETIVSQQFFFRGQWHVIQVPYMLIGTQGPSEQEPSTLTPLQTDRFLFQIACTFPEYDEEVAIASATLIEPDTISAVMSPEQLLALQDAAKLVEAPERLVQFATRLVRGTRVHEGEHDDFVYEWVSSGAGVRASNLLVRAARSRALINGRAKISADDIRTLAYPILRHRIALNQNALSHGITVDQVITRLLDTTEE